MTLDFSDIDFSGVGKEKTPSVDFSDIDFGAVQKQIQNESIALKNTSDPDADNVATSIMDEILTGDNHKVTRLNQYINSLSEQGKVSYNEKSIGKDLETKLKEVEKIYSDEQQLPKTKFFQGYQAARDRISLDLTWWEDVAKEKDPEIRKQNIEKLAIEEDMFNQKWSKKEEAGGLWEGTGGFLGSQVALGNEAIPEAVAGAGAGAGAALLFGQAGPQAGIPEEIFTVPGLGIKGARTGYMIGSAKASKAQGAGEVYKDLIMNGIEHETAVSVADKAGNVYGSLEFLQLDKLLPGGKKIAGNVLKQIIKKGLDYGQEVGQESLQRLTTDMAKDIGVLKGEGKDAKQIQQALLKNADKYWEGMKEEAKASAGPMAIIGAPGVVIDTRATIKEAQVEAAKPKPTMQEKQIDRVKKLYDTYGIDPENVKKEIEITKPDGERVKANAEGLVVRISELADETTGDHEAFHVIANNFANEADYKAAKEEAKTKTGWDNDADLDEYLADEFAKWRLNKESKGPMGKVFSQITDGIKDVLGKDKQTRKLFNDFEKGVNINEQSKAKIQYQEELSKGEKAKRAEAAISKLYENKKAEKRLATPVSKRQSLIDKQQVLEKQKEYGVSDAELKYYKDYLTGVAEYSSLANEEKSLLANMKEYLKGKAIRVPTNKEGKMVGEYEGFNQQFPGLFSTKEGQALDDILTEFNEVYNTDYNESTFRAALTAAQKNDAIKKMKITDADALEFAIQDKEAEAVDFDFTGKPQTVARDERIKEAGAAKQAAIEKQLAAQEKITATEAKDIIKQATVPGVRTTKATITKAVVGEKAKATITENQGLKTKYGYAQKVARDAVAVGKAVEKFNNKVRKMTADAKTRRKKLAKTLGLTYKKMWRELKQKTLPVDSYKKIMDLMETDINVLSGFKDADYARYSAWLKDINNRVKMIAEGKQVFVNKTEVDKLRRKVTSLLERNLDDLSLQQLYSKVMGEYTDGKARMAEYNTLKRAVEIAKGNSIKQNSINKLYNGKRNYAEKIFNVKQPGRDVLLKASDNFVMEKIESIKYFKNLSTLEMATPYTVMEAIDGGISDGEMANNFMKPLQEGFNEQSLAKELFIPVYEKLTEAKLSAGKHWNKTKEIAGLNLTSKGKIMIALYADNDLASSHMYEDGITPEQVRKVIASLTKEEKAVYDEIRKVIDTKATPLLSQKIEENENLPGEIVLSVDKYFPIKLLSGQGQKNNVMDLDIAFDKGTGQILGFDKGWMLGRSRHNYKIDLNDLEGILNAYIDRTSRYIGFADKYDGLWGVEKEIEPVLTKRYGPRMTSWLKNLLNDVMLGTARQEASAIKALKGKTYGVHLSWNPRVWVVQAVSLCNGINSIGLKDSLAGVNQMAKNPTKQIEAINKESVYMRNRTIDAIFEYYKKTDENKLKKLGAAGMRPIFLIDQMTAGSVWLGAKEKHLAKNPGDVAGAIKYADYIVATTQPQGGLLYQPQVKRGTGAFGSWGQGLSMYMSQRFQNFGSLVKARVLSQNGLDKKAFAKAFMWIVLLPGILVDVLKKGRYADLFRLFTADDDDTEDKMKKITSITGNMLQQAIPYMGTMSSMMEPTSSGIRFAQFGAIEKGVKTIGETKRLIERQTPEQLAKTLLTGGEAILNWNHVNTNTIHTPVKGLQKIHSGKDLRLEGLLISHKSLGQRDLDDVTDPKSKINLLASKIKKAKARGDLGKARQLQREKVRLSARSKRRQT